MVKVYDMLILGAGPAGITASVYALRKRLDILVVSKDIGGQAAWSSDVENYTGYQFISGLELTEKFREHMQSAGVAVNMPEEVKKLSREKNLLKVSTDKNDYFSRTVVLATGKRPRPLDVPGEKKFKNRGVTYCATCDGPLFRDKNVAVIGGGNSAMDAVLQLMKICPRVYLINSAGRLSGDAVMIEKIEAADNVKIMNDTEVRAISGAEFVRAVEISSGNTGKKIDVEGVFVEIGLIPNSECAALLQQNALGEIIVNNRNETEINGIFAAGDVTDVPEKQIIVACGEGAKASLSAFRYLATHRW